MVVWVKEKPLLLPLKLWSTDYLFYMLKQKEDKINSTCSTKNENNKKSDWKNKKDPVWSKPVIVNYVWKSKKKKYDLHNFYRILKKVIVSSLKKARTRIAYNNKPEFRHYYVLWRRKFRGYPLRGSF